MHQDRKFSAATRNSRLPGKFHWSLYGICSGEREGGTFFSFFLPGCLGFVLVLVTWRVGRTALKLLCYPLYAYMQLRS